MKIPEKSRTLPSIARTLKSQGYATSYLYGGDINFTNMRSYLIATGWEQLMSMANFTLEQQHTILCSDAGPDTASSLRLYRQPANEASSFRRIRLCGRSESAGNNRSSI
jgi:hypothetical protein